MRTIAKSRHNPQFGEAALAASVRARKITLPPYDGIGRFASCTQGQRQRRLAERLVPGVRGLHADGRVPPTRSTCSWSEVITVMQRSCVRKLCRGDAIVR